MKKQHSDLQKEEHKDLLREEKEEGGKEKEKAKEFTQAISRRHHLQDKRKMEKFLGGTRGKPSHGPRGNKNESS